MNFVLRTACLAAILIAAACRPEMPPTEQPPVPTAKATELRDAIKAPQEKAKAAQDAMQQATDKQQAQLEAAEQ